MIFFSLAISLGKPYMLKDKQTCIKIERIKAKSIMSCNKGKELYDF